MPWSAGTFTRTYGSTGWQGDAAAGTPIVADRHDTNDQDLATGINACLNKDGSNSMTANLNMGGFIPTNLGAGTAAAPAICAGNDQDTGIFAPAANEIGFATNGAEKIRIDANGRLGVGVTAPAVGFDLLGNIRISDVATDATNKVGRIRGRSFTNSQGDWLAVDAQGLSGDNRVQVGGGSGSLNCATSITFLTAANTTTTSGTERMRITSTGLVGIGTQSPSARLTVAGALPDAAGAATNPGTIQLNEQSITNFTTTGGLEFKGSASGSGYGSKLLGFDNGDLIFLNRSNSATWTESFRVKADTNRVGIGTSTPSYQLQLGSDSAAKPTTNTWTIASDERIKTNIQPYTKGLEAILQVEPITYDYNGKGGMAAGPGGISILAQALQPVFPECVGSYKGKLNEDDEEETDILNYNGHAMTFALINAVKELSTKLDALTERVEALEA